MNSKKFENFLISALFAIAISGLSFITVKLPSILSSEKPADYQESFFSLIDQLKNASFLKEYPYILVIAVWTIIGIIIYYLFYTLNIVYADLYNVLITKFFYTEPNIDEKEIKIKFLRRVFFHSLIIIGYLFIFFFIVFLPFPFTENIRIFSETIFRNFTGSEIAFYSSLGISFIYWLTIISFAQFLYGKIKYYLSEERSLEEHNSTF